MSRHKSLLAALTPLLAALRPVLPALRPVLPALLSILGLVFLAVAAFTMGVTIGFAVAGLGLLVLAYYAESEARP